MKAKILSAGYLYGLLLVLLFCLAFFIRGYFPIEKILGSEWIKVSGTDAYYHMRLVDNIVHNFPHIAGFDPYFIYPAGSDMGGFYLFDWLLSSLIWMIGLGSPTLKIIDLVGVYYPVVLGALTVIPVYFLGKALFNRWAGIIAATLVGILPGEFLGRSILGFTDHHVGEVLFSTTAVLFFVLAIKSAKRCGLTLESIRERKGISRPIIHSLLGGLFMGIYFLIWPGGLLFVFIIYLFLIIQFVVDHLKRQNTDYLGLVSTLIFLVLVVVVACSGFVREGFVIYIIPLLIALLVPPILVALSRVMVYRNMRPLNFPLAILGIGLVIIAVFYAVSPFYFEIVLGRFAIFLPTVGASSTTMEMRPFFAPVVEGGGFFLTPAWLNLNTALPLSIFSFLILTGIVSLKKQLAPEKVFFLMWCLVIFAITVMQRRFNYYFTVNAALLTGYIAMLCYLIIPFIINRLRREDTGYLWRQIQEYAGIEFTGSYNETFVSQESNKAKDRNTRSKMHYLGHILAVLIVFPLVLFPSIDRSPEVAGAASFTPSDGWYSALTWMEENTPEPFGDPDAYYRLFESPPVGEKFNYPETAYGVLSWWDYGYWITRVAHRLPYTNPSQAPDPIIRTANVLLSQGEAEAKELIEETNTAYIISDYAMATGKFWAIAEWGGREQSEFYDIYYMPIGNQLRPIRFYYPEYYRSLLVRLYNFNGEAVIPDRTLVISYVDQVTADGNSIRKLTGIKVFTDYQAAVDYVNGQEHGNFRIVGENRFISAVPLEALKDYRLVFGSREAVKHNDMVINVDKEAGKVDIVTRSNLVSEVKVFEHKRD